MGLDWLRDPALSGSVNACSGHISAETVGDSCRREQRTRNGTVHLDGICGQEGIHLSRAIHKVSDGELGVMYAALCTGAQLRREVVSLSPFACHSFANAASLQCRTCQPRAGDEAFYLAHDCQKRKCVHHRSWALLTYSRGRSATRAISSQSAIYHCQCEQQ